MNHDLAAETGQLLNEHAKIKYLANRKRSQQQSKQIMIKLNVKPAELTDEVSRRGSFFKYLPQGGEVPIVKNEVKVR
jgi:hypothetical protein